VSLAEQTIVPVDGGLDAVHGFKPRQEFKVDCAGRRRPAPGVENHRIKQEEERMNIIDGMIGEVQYEATLTRKVLERVPDDKLGYKPHAKSFSMGQLASHLADSLSWAEVTCQMDRFEFDMENWKMWEGGNSAEIVAKLDECLGRAVAAMKPMTDEDLFKTWTMADTKGNVMMAMPRIQVLRAMILNHTIHHRGQLTVYLRMNDVPVPSIYGPSADEQG
jgi:uncharacterized damage-inducible protein DinB